MLSQKYQTQLTISSRGNYTNWHSESWLAVLHCLARLQCLICANRLLVSHIAVSYMSLADNGIACILRRLAEH